MNFTDLAITLGTNPAGEPILLKYGVFLQTMFDFVIIAAAIFMALKAINKLKTPPPAAAAAPPADVVLLTEIRDLLKKISAAQTDWNASRVRFSGAPFVQTTSSSMRMPPNGLQRAIASQSMCAPRRCCRGLVEQQVDEVQARLDRDHEPRLEHRASGAGNGWPVRPRDLGATRHRPRAKPATSCTCSRAGDRCRAGRTRSYTPFGDGLSRRCSRYDARLAPARPRSAECASRCISR